MKRIFVVDDHPMLREGILRQVESTPGLQVCGEAATAKDAFQEIQRELPDLVLMDISLPDKSGLELIKDLQSFVPQVAILVFSMHDEILYAERVMRAGAKGYLMKGAGSDKLKEAIQRVLSGELYLSSKISTQIINGLSGKNSANLGLRRLSDRELEIFDLIGRGHTNMQIAEKLHISVRTVDAHRTNIKAKLNLADGASLVRKAILWVEDDSKEFRP